MVSFNIKFIALLLIILTFHVKCQMSSDNVVVALNCGGNTFKDSRGIVYQKDMYYDKGESSDFGSNFDIKLTNDQELYQSERWSNEDLKYSIPLNNAGKYVLVLKFSEVYFNSPGEKIFNIALGKETIVNSLDIYSKVGKAAAYDEFVPFEIKNNKVLVNNRFADGAYDEENGVVNLIFKKTERDNPKINAIVIVKGTLSDTDYESYKAQLDEFERQIQEKERKQREFQKVSKVADYEEFEDDFVDNKELYQGSSSINLSTIILMTIGGLAVYFIYFRSSKSEEI